ncbi:MAG: LysR family transcriptional regulator [Gammaproteobacteria bacterium RIFCSPHIGHO2_12_FULL_63_22]|nr:MAG: LysR family transcriptional regulator [Gammaproteobacteria bacterium RIFCSPHIGHO2_12_FULL_63_22]
MDRFHLMAVFVAVAEEEGFAAAARRLRMSPPAVTRAIAFLEERLGVRLLTRTTRLVRITDAGARYLEDARRILLEADEADEAAAGINATPRGHLAVTAPVLFGKTYVMPVITAYLATFRQMTTSALFVDRVVNLLDEGLDVGIRIGSLPDSSLRAIRVGTVRRVVCASPAYLKQHGTPKTPADVAKHTIVAAASISADSEWTFRKGKAKIGVRFSPRIVVNTNDGALEAAKSGFGLTRLISYQVANELAAGTLKAVLRTYEEPSLPVHVVHREGRHGSAKVRSFVDLAVEQLRSNKALQ